LNEELENLNRKTLTFNKGTLTIETAKSLADLKPGNSREVLFNTVKDLFALSRKALTLIQSSDVTVQPKLSDQDTHTLESIIKKQLTDVLPDLLKNAMSSLSPSDSETIQVEKPPPTRHTLTISKKSEGEEEEEEKEEDISNGDWLSMRRDVKGSLKAVPVKSAGVWNGKPNLALLFDSKDDMDKAEVALTEKYKVSSKSVDRKLLEPKLSITNIDPEIPTKEKLLEELLDENKFIRELNGAEKVKVAYFDDKENFAVIQVSADIREAIRRNGDHVHLGLQRHHVKDRIHVVQCYHCQEFGHMSGSRYCKSTATTDTCFYCAGSHASKDCNHKKDRKISKIKCSNCVKSKSLAERNAASTHKASDTLCPFYIRETERVMSRTIGCTQESKNSYRKKVQDLKMKLGRR